MNDFDSIIKRITVTRLEPGDYTGEDGPFVLRQVPHPETVSHGGPAVGGPLAPPPLPL